MGKTGGWGKNFSDVFFLDFVIFSKFSTSGDVRTHPREVGDQKPGVGGKFFPMFFFWTLSFFQSFRHRGMFGHIRGKSVTQNWGLGEKFFRCFFLDFVIFSKFSTSGDVRTHPREVGDGCGVTRVWISPE